MALTLKTLRAGTLGTGAAAVLYPSAQATKNALIKNIILTNKTGTAATANILLAANDQSPSGDVQISPKDISIPPNSQVILDAEITLNLNTASYNTIKGTAGTGSAIDYIINGLERDV